MSARPEPRASNLTRRLHPAVPVDARAAIVETSSSGPEPRDAEKSAPALAQVNVRIEKELVRRVKARLAIEGRTMQQLLGEFMQEWVEK
jgi:hypothetical protein